MNLRTLLHGKAWNDPALVWPIRRTLPLRSTPLPAKVRGTAPAWDTFVKYNELMNPAVDEDNTNLGCCAIENGSKPVEVDYARDTKTYAPLRHAEIYQKLLFMINGNDKDSGFELLEAMNGLKALGIIKPDTAIEEVELAEGAIQTALQRGPLVWGVIASGIMPQELSADGLGWADEEKIKEAFGQLAGGHCMCHFANLHSNGYNVGVFRNAGWGGYGLNLHGIVMATTWWMLAAALCKPLLLTHESGSIVGPDYERWTQA